MSYKVVDLRGKVQGCTPVSNIGTRKKSGGKVTEHYNGPDTALGRYGGGQEEVIRQLIADANYQMVRGRYSPGFAVNGLQYHEVIWGDTVYILRNADAVLWHAADEDYNWNGVSLHVPIGESQYLNARTLQTLAERSLYHLKAQGTTSRARVVGHKEVSDLGTACPGHVMEQFVYPFRSGKLNVAPEKPAFDDAKYNLVYADDAPWAKERAEYIAREVNSKKSGLVAVAGGKNAIQWITEKILPVYPAGKQMCVVVGEKAAGHLSQGARAAMTKYGPEESDIWDGRYAGELRDSLMELVEREKLPESIVTEYTKRYGGSPKGSDSGKGEGPLTLNQLTSLYQTMSRDYYASRLDGLNKAMRDGSIDTPRRLAYFLANVGHESGGLKYVEEIASGAAYEWRRDLGNVYAGDGVRFKGRGYIQLTGRANYTAFSKAMGVDFVSNPEKVEEPYWAAMSAVWFWNSRNLSASADAGDWANVCYRINGRYPANGQADRDAYLRKAQAILK